MVPLTLLAGLVGLLQPPGQPMILTRLDPLSLEPIPPPLLVGEYHYAWSFSHDRTELALATGGRGIGVRIVDLEEMTVRHEVRTGIAAEALGWLGQNRLVAALQDGDLVVVDTEKGRVVRRRALPLPIDAHAGPQPAAPSPHGLVILLQDPLPQDSLLRKPGPVPPPRVVLAQADGDYRSVRLDEIRLVERLSSRGLLRDRAGLAVEASGERAYVVAAGSPLAEIDLRTMSIRYRALPDPLSLGAVCPGAAARKAACSSIRSGNALGPGKVALFGSDLVVGPGGHLDTFASGVVVLDTDEWTGFRAQGANGAISAPDRILVFGGGSDTGVGLRGYGLDGRLRFHFFGAERISEVTLALGRAYARGRGTVRLVEPRSGDVFREIDAPSGRFELLGEAPR